MERDKYAPGHEMSNQQWWLPTTSLLHLFCTTSLLRTILDPARWWLDKKFDSWSTAWKSTCGTMAVQLQQSHPCEWQTQDSSQAKQNYHCMVAGIELERRATVHEMSNQQSEKQIFPNTNLDRLGKTARHAYNFFALPTRSLLKTILDPASWWLPLLYRSGIKWAKWESRKQSFPNAWIALWKLVDTYNFSASPF